MPQVFTNCKVPYYDLFGDDLNAIKQHVHAGHRLAPPRNMPDSIANMMQRCWLVPRQRRPTFSELALFFEELCGDVYTCDHISIHSQQHDSAVSTASEGSTPSARARPGALEYDPYGSTDSKVMIVDEPAPRSAPLLPRESRGDYIICSQIDGFRECSL
jgi:hypothetical protein